MRKILGAIFAIFALAATAQAGTVENKETVLAFYQALYGDQDTQQFVADDYVEHQQGSGFTLDGLLEMAGKNAGAVTVHRIIAQEDLVFLHVEQQTATGAIARGELFRLNDKGLIVEHWGNQQVAVPASDTKSGNSMFDGVAKVNLNSQAALKYGAAHLKAMDMFWNSFDTSVIPGSLTEAYIQHNPRGANGPNGLLGMVGFLQSKGISLEKVLHQSVSEGDFIVKLNFYRSTPPVPGFGQAIAFDIIRLTEDGRADEHWDIVEEIANVADIADLF